MAIFQFGEKNKLGRFVDQNDKRYSSYANKMISLQKVLFYGIERYEMKQWTGFVTSLRNILGHIFKSSKANKSAVICNVN